MIVRRPLAALLMLGLALSGCRKAEVTAYRVPKEKDPAPPAAAVAAGNMSMPAMPAMSAPAGPELTWTAPSHWQSKAPTAMRKATFAVPGEGGEADLSITVLGSDGGGELANLNRWRGQPPFSLPPIAASELAAAVERRERNGLKFGIVELTSKGTPAARLLGAWVPFADSTWFFKFTGPDALVAKEKAAFLAFLDSIKPASAP